MVATMSVSKFKAAFFSTKAVTDRLSKAEKAVYSRAGAFVMTTARRSIRYRKRPSAPGTPPSGHRSAWLKKTNRRTRAVKIQLASPLREFIFFAWDEYSRSVVIGPAALHHKGGPKALKSLEFGGPTTILAGRGRKRKVVMVKRRPFMRPALEKELPKIPQLWRGKLKP